MQQKSLLSISPLGFHKLAYTEWGETAAAQTIVCVHGLTRNSRDFDYLAKDLGTKARVVCPDLPGRGDSEWLKDPRLYNQAQYVVDLTTLLARLDVKTVTWIGTSLGGILGMYLAAQANTPIKALILNDVGPYIPRASLARIGKYAHNTREFATLQEAENYFRNIYKDIEHLTDEEWQYRTAHSVKQQADGKFILAYDPNVSHAMHKFLPTLTGINLWNLWHKIQCPILVIRGAKSDVLLAETCAEMRKCKAQVTIHEVPDCGHTPSLISADQIELVSNWIEANT